MSISSEISRISGNVSSALTAISNKGVTVPSGSNSDDLADLIALISGGGQTTTVIIPEQSITCSNTSGTQITNFTEGLIVGEQYIATINGVAKTITATPESGHVALYYESNLDFFYANGSMFLFAEDSSAFGTYTAKVERITGGGGGATLITKTITQNGTYDAEDDDADGYSSVTVNVSGGGGGLVYETGTYTPTSDIAKPTISFTNTHANRPIFFEIMDLNNSSTSSNSIIYVTFASLYDEFGKASYNGYYGRVNYAYGSSNGATVSGTSVTSLTLTTSSGMSYWVTNSEFTPNATNSSRVFRSGRSYGWIAVWAPTT